ncbi:MAG TPA: Minf_1886 family protein [Candidatus Methylacidiphilales bacterium]|nr:Minf_1886 family protein [Candidatus Methylacidiphilales bacterium]
MAKNNFTEAVEQISAKDPRYASDAYHFVQEGLNHTLKSLKRGSPHTHRHVSGQELLHGLRNFALKEYGPMSKAVLNEWGIKTTDDFGQIVFNLVHEGVLGKNETDSPNDFKNVFTFDEAFVKPFEPRNSANLRRPATAAKASSKRTTGSKKKKAGSL